MNWEFLLTFACFFIALAAFLYSILLNMEKRMNSKFDGVYREIDGVKEELNNKIDGVKGELNNKIDGVSKEIQDVKENIREIRSYVVFGHIKDKASNE